MLLLCSHICTPGLSHPNVVVLTVAGAFIGAALGFVVATIMESAVSTVFVCFAEDPKALEISHPDLSDRLVEAWETMLQVRTVGQNSEVLAVVKSDHWPFF